MRINPDHQSSKFRGFVVEYPNDPAYKGTNGYLLVKDRRRKEATYCYALSACTIFHSREEAREWADRFPYLMGENGYKLPEVLPVWMVCTFTLENPDRQERVKKTGDSGMKAPEKYKRDDNSLKAGPYKQLKAGWETQ